MRARCAPYARADGGEPCVTHNDFFELNFVGADDALYLIDWEYAGMGDYANDLGTFTLLEAFAR